MRIKLKDGRILQLVSLSRKIQKSKKKWKPKNISLSVFAKNKPAINLYKKLGFKEFARFPKWLKYGNKYMDKLYLIYKS